MCAAVLLLFELKIAMGLAAMVGMIEQPWLKFDEELAFMTGEKYREIGTHTKNSIRSIFSKEKVNYLHTLPPSSWASTR